MHCAEVVVVSCILGQGHLGHLAARDHLDCLAALGSLAGLGHPADLALQAGLAGLADLAVLDHLVDQVGRGRPVVPAHLADLGLL